MSDMDQPGNPEQPDGPQQAGTSGWSEQTKLVMVDGRDALAYVIIRPGGAEDGNNIVIEAQAMGISQKQAAYVMRELARVWDPPAADAPCACATSPV